MSGIGYIAFMACVVVGVMRYMDGDGSDAWFAAAVIIGFLEARFVIP